MAFHVALREGASAPMVLYLCVSVNVAQICAAIVTLTVGTQDSLEHMLHCLADRIFPPCVQGK